MTIEIPAAARRTRNDKTAHDVRGLSVVRKDGADGHLATTDCIPTTITYESMQ